MRGNRNESGISAVEYGLIVAGIASLLIVLPLIFAAFKTGIEECTIAGLEMRHTPQWCENSPYK